MKGVWYCINYTRVILMTYSIGIKVVIQTGSTNSLGVTDNKKLYNDSRQQQNVGQPKQPRKHGHHPFIKQPFVSTGFRPCDYR